MNNNDNNRNISNEIRILIIVLVTLTTLKIVFMLWPATILESVAIILVFLGIPVEISLFLLFDKYCL